MKKAMRPPTKKRLYWLTALWLTGLLLLVLAQTDLFRESLFQRKNFGLFLPVVLLPTVSLLVQWKQYKQHQSTQETE